MEGQTGLAQLFFPSRETILAVLPTLGITSAGGRAALAIYSNHVISSRHSMKAAFPQPPCDI
jgi:hypothetical protein